MDDIRDPSLEAPAREAAERGLCAHCLGRPFARVDHGYGNDERGRILADEWGLETVDPEGCQVCRGLMGRLEALAEVVEADLAELAFDTFLVGTRVDHEVETREETLFRRLDAEHTESIGTELNREVGKRLEEGHEGWAVDLEAPDVAAVVDTTFHHVDLDVKPVYVYGRYRKHARGIPQTIWPCGRCRGSGCTDCQGSGRQYLLSVEDLVAKPAMRLAEAHEATFHGAGREDVDARMVGTGRPFVLELTDPARRELDVEALREAINDAAEPAVDVGPLKLVDKETVPLVKEASGSKTYEMDVAFEDPATTETLKKACRMLEGAEVAQRTPSRVSHRRADKVRRRTVTRCRVQSAPENGREARILVAGDAGLYVKEFVSGDGGRTEPSLAEAVGTSATCTALDVVRVEGPDGLDDERAPPPPE